VPRAQVTRIPNAWHSAGLGVSGSAARLVPHGTLGSMQTSRNWWIAFPLALFGLLLGAAILVLKEPAQEDFPQRVWLPTTSFRNAARGGGADGVVQFHRQSSGPADPDLTGYFDTSGEMLLLRMPDLSPGPWQRWRLFWMARDPPMPTWYDVVGDGESDAGWVEFRRQDDL